MKDMLANVTYGDLIEIAERIEHRLTTKVDVINSSNNGNVAAFKGAISAALTIIVQEFREIAS